MAKPTPPLGKASLSAVMIKIYSIAALILVFVATATLITNLRQPSSLDANQNEQGFTESHDIQLSGLAIEGKDIFLQEGCIYCHSKKTQNASLVLAGALFAPQFPFQNLVMDESQLRGFLSGWEQKEDDLTHEYIVHAPQFTFLETEMLSGSHTQAKMILNSQAQYARETLVQASQRTAGISQLDALMAYLQETSTIKATQDTLQDTTPL